MRGDRILQRCESGVPAAVRPYDADQPCQIYYPILALGAIAAGGIYSGYNPGYTPFEITHHLKTIHAKFVICEPELLQTVLDAKHDVPKERIFMFDNIGQAIPQGFKGWKTLLEHGEVDWCVPSSLSPTMHKLPSRPW